MAGIAAGKIAPVAVATTWGDAFLQLDDLEAALLLRWTRGDDRALAAGFQRLLGRTRFHGNLLSNGLR
jgi:hypothetical protein